MEEKITALKKRLCELADGGALCVAFSGGVDSSLLVKAARDEGIEVFAVTFDTTLQPGAELRLAELQANQYGAKHVVLPLNPLQNVQVRRNSHDRCYHCKHLLFSRLREYAKIHALAAIVDGTNADDLQEYRPGLRALEELEIESPLAALGLSKAQVREMAQALGVVSAKKPSTPCLATRFPYDTPLDEQQLCRVANAEELLHGAGFPVVRVRSHGELARIEVPTDRFTDLVMRADWLSDALCKMGFAQVTLDLAGFRSGSFDRVNLKKRNR